MPLRLLLVESNPADAFLTMEALKQAGWTEGITTVEDSQQALDYLRTEIPGPDLVFLDLNVAPMTGLEVLQQIRADARIGTIPVAIVSGSENKEDIRKAYQLGANCYLNKPAKLEEFLRYMKTCYEFWGTVATLPPK